MLAKKDFGELNIDPRECKEIRLLFSLLFEFRISHGWGFAE